MPHSPDRPTPRKDNINWSRAAQRLLVSFGLGTILSLAGCQLDTPARFDNPTPPAKNYDPEPIKTQTPASLPTTTHLRVPTRGPDSDLSIGERPTPNQLGISVEFYGVLVGQGDERPHIQPENAIGLGIITIPGIEDEFEAIQIISGETVELPKTSIITHNTQGELTYYTPGKEPSDERNFLSYSLELGITDIKVTTPNSQNNPGLYDAVEIQTTKTSDGETIKEVEEKEGYIITGIVVGEESSQDGEIIPTWAYRIMDEGEYTEWFVTANGSVTTLNAVANQTLPVTLPVGFSPNNMFIDVDGTPVLISANYDNPYKLDTNRGWVEQIKEEELGALDETTKLDILNHLNSPEVTRSISVLDALHIVNKDLGDEFSVEDIEFIHGQSQEIIEGYINGKLVIHMEKDVNDWNTYIVSDTQEGEIFRVVTAFQIERIERGEGQQFTPIIPIIPEQVSTINLTDQELSDYYADTVDLLELTEQEQELLTREVPPAATEMFDAIMVRIVATMTETNINEVREGLINGETFTAIIGGTEFKINSDTVLFFAFSDPRDINNGTDYLVRSGASQYEDQLLLRFGYVDPTGKSNPPATLQFPLYFFAPFVTEIYNDVSPEEAKKLNTLFVGINPGEQTAHNLFSIFPVAEEFPLKH